MLIIRLLKTALTPSILAWSRARALDAADYPLATGSGADLFNWPAVVEDPHLRGYPSMAVSWLRRRDRLGTGTLRYSQLGNIASTAIVGRNAA